MPTSGHTTYMKAAIKGDVPTVPLKYAGKWIAWSFDHTEIVASGDHLKDVHDEVRQAGGDVSKVWFDKVPDANIRFGGAAFRG